MTDHDLSQAVWRKSAYSGGATNCVEVAGGLAPIVAVRDSKDPAGPALTISCGAWDTFAAGIKSGKYDSRLGHAAGGDPAVWSPPCRQFAQGRQIT